MGARTLNALEGKQRPPIAFLPAAAAHAHAQSHTLFPVVFGVGGVVLGFPCDTRKLSAKGVTGGIAAAK